MCAPAGGPQNFGDTGRGLGIGRGGWPLKTWPSPTCYCARFVCSRSNRVGVHLHMEILLRNGSLASHLTTSFKVIGTDKHQCAIQIDILLTYLHQVGTCDFLSVIHSNQITLDLSRTHTISKINDNFGWKSQIFPTPVYLTQLRWRLPQEFCNGVCA